MDRAELREQVAAGCRVLAQQGLVHEVAGHVSARVPGAERMLIRGRSAAEKGVRFTAPEAVRECGFRGEDHAGDGYELPLELPIHGEIYLLRDDVNAVVHAHPTYSVLCSIAGVPLAPVYGGYDSGGLRLALRGVPVYPHSRLVDDQESGQELARALADRQVCLMRGHGIAAAGRDVPEAVLNAVRLERLAFVSWQLHLAGASPGPVTAEDAAFFTQPYKRAMGADLGATGGSDRGSDTEWRWRSYLAEDEAAGGRR